MSKRQRYDIGLPSTNEISHSTSQSYDLQPWNIRLEEVYQRCAAGDELPAPFLPENMWNEWLWGFDPVEACNIECLMNRSHLLGLLLARYRAMYQVRYSTSTSTLAELLGCKSDVAHYQRLCLFNTPVSTYSLRHLRDTVQNIQLNWVNCSCPSIPEMKEVIDALMHRFGVLALAAKGVVEMDDQGEFLHCVVRDSGSRFGETDLPIIRVGSVEDALGAGGLLAMNRICLRRFVNTFMIMYRHLHFHACAESLPQRDDDWFDCSIKSHHLTASADDFSGIGMHWDLMMAAKLNYIHDFPGPSYVLRFYYLVQI
jgi:hypothetical protein